VDTDSHKENASKQESRASFRFDQNRLCSRLERLHAHDAYGRWWDVASCWAAAARFGGFQKKPATDLLRAGFTIFAIMSFCR